MTNASNQSVIAKQARKSYPKLWEEDSSSSSPNITNKPSKHMPVDIVSGTEASFHWARSVPKTALPSSGLRFASTTSTESFYVRFKIVFLRSLVIAQQFALSTLFLAAIRCVICRSFDDLEEDTCVPCMNDEKLVLSLQSFTLTLLILFPSTLAARRQNGRKNMQNKRERIHSRSVDAILIAGILRFLSSVLRTLTASYSSDTVTALAIAGMVLHVLSADYNYANGISERAELQHLKASHSYAEKKRPLFLGGTMSINCVFFSAALLASRLPSDTISYIFYMWTVVLFAYYPETRYLIAHTQFGRKVNFVMMAGVSVSSFSLLNDGIERMIFLFVQCCILLFSPMWKSSLRKYKEKITGPWDIAHIKKD